VCRFDYVDGYVMGMFFALVKHVVPLCLQWPLAQLFSAAWASDIGQFSVYKANIERIKLSAYHFYCFFQWILWTSHLHLWGQVVLLNLMKVDGLNEGVSKYDIGHKWIFLVFYKTEQNEIKISLKFGDLLIICFIP
jgi:hypothetical protein